MHPPSEGNGVDPKSAGSTNLLGRAFERMPVAMVVVDRDGEIVMVNLETEKVFGYTRDELVGQFVEKLVPARFHAAHPGYRNGFFAETGARSMGAGRDLFGRRKDGSEFPVEIGLNPIDTEHGPMVLSAIVDITQRRRLERRFQQVVESAPSAMVMVDSAGIITMVNAQTEKLFGYARSALLGQSMDRLLPERFRGGHPALRRGFFAAPKARAMGAGRDLYGLRGDGSEFPVEIGLNPIETDEGPMVLSAIVDISERKQREERIRVALQEKDLLLGEIHHRVKNNLQIIDSLLDLQASRISDPAVQATLRDSQNRIRSMSLIHQTLYQSHDFARVDFQRFIGELVPVLMNSYASGAGRVAMHIEAQRVELPINVAIPCGLMVNELVTNALKHGFPAGVSGNIWVGLKQQLPNEAVLTVSNDGAPITPELDITRAGTLGIQLVGLLAQQIKGRLEIQRAGPTRFTVCFPTEVPA